MAWLKTQGFTDETILKVMEDVDIRLKWNVNSKCSLYSRSKEKWYEGEIVDVFNDKQTNAEWLMVRYGPKKKRVQRFCADIKPIEFGDEYNYNDKAIQLAVNKIKSTESVAVCLFIFSFCVIAHCL